MRLYFEEILPLENFTCENFSAEFHKKLVFQFFLEWYGRRLLIGPDGSPNLNIFYNLLEENG